MLNKKAAVTSQNATFGTIFALGKSKIISLDFWSLFVKLKINSNFKNNKKAIGPVVASALLLVVAVISVAGFQTFFDTYQTGLNTKVEQQSSSPFNTGIETLVGSTLYFKNGGNSNITITSIKVGTNDCNISGSYGGGMNPISLGNNCTQNLTTSTPEIIIYTDQKIYSKKVFISGVVVVSNLDSLPDAFNFSNLTKLSDSYALSNIVIPVNFTGPVTVSITGSQSPQLRVNGGSWTSSTSINPSNTLQLRVLSPSIVPTTITLNLTLGDFTTSWNVTSRNPLASFATDTTNGTGRDRGRSIFVDNSGNIYATGTTTSNLSFGNGVSMTNDGDYDFFLVKYNSSGVAQWAADTTGGTGFDRAYDVYVDNSGNVYAIGEIGSSINFGNGVSISYDGGSNDFFLVKYNSSGVAQWAADTTGGTGTDAGNGIYVDSVGNIYATGRTVSNLDFGNGVSITNDGGNDFFLVIYNSSGTAQWAADPTGNTATGIGNGVYGDSSGNIYATGVSSSFINFGNGVSMTNYGAGDFFLVKYNSSGVAQWVTDTTGSTGDDGGYDVYVDSSGNIYATGYTGSSLNFGNGVSMTNDGGTYDFFLVKYNSSGVAQWAADTTGGSGWDEGDKIFIDSLDNIYITGWTSTSLDFGNSVSLTYDGGTYDFFIVKYNSSGTAQWVTDTTGGTGDDGGYGVYGDSSGNIYATGYSYSNLNFGNGVSITNDGLDDFFVVKYD